jgi:hypothetical protein
MIKFDVTKIESLRGVSNSESRYFKAFNFLILGAIHGVTRSHTVNLC